MIKIAFVGGGPATVLLLQQATKKLQPCAITIFEADEKFGPGMPYSAKGANKEHLTNVSSDEIPALTDSLVDWLHRLGDAELKEFDLQRSEVTEKIVVSRVLFGRYLEAQFNLLVENAVKRGFEISLQSSTRIEKLVPIEDRFILSAGSKNFEFDVVVICTGHLLPKTAENEVAGYFDSPYPPSKLQLQLNHAVCVRGSSLTAIDAVATLARANGSFVENESGLEYVLNKSSSDFRLDMYSRDALLPAVRAHMDEPYPGQSALIDSNLIRKEIARNGGFLPLDFMYEKAFLEPLKAADKKFFDSIKDLSIEQFVDRMMTFRKSQDAFVLLRSEYEASLKSIAEKKSIPWQELLGGLSVALNYPAKHFSAEDTIRLRKILMPLIGTIISFAPQRSVEELLALYEAGVLSLNTVSDEAEVIAEGDNKIVYKLDDQTTKTYKTFVDCVGQSNLNASELPLRGLMRNGLGRQAFVRFRDESIGAAQLAQHPKTVKRDAQGYILTVPGVDITDHFQLVDRNGDANSSLYMIAVPFIAGLNPDYSGLDFCDNASRLVIEHIRSGRESKAEQVSNRQAT